MNGTYSMLWVVAAAALAAPTSAQESYRLSDMDVSIYNLAGTVEIVPGAGSDVVVEVNRGGVDGADLTVEVSTISGREALRVVYPSDRVVYTGGQRGNRSNTELRVRDDGTFYGSGRRSGRRVRVSTQGRGLEAHADLVVRVPSGRSVNLYLAVGASQARDLDGDLLLDQGSGAAEVSGVRGSVRVDTGSGGVTVRNVQGPVVSIDTGSGGVVIGEIRADEVEIDTGSGRVEGVGLVTPQLRVDTGSGSVELAGIESPDVVCDTGSGAVRLAFDTDIDQVEVDTGSGSIELLVPADSGAELELDTGNGGIEVDLPVRLTRSDRRHLEGSLGDGRGRVQLDTGSGAIRIRGR